MPSNVVQLKPTEKNEPLVKNTTDFYTVEGRKEALSRVALMCIEGYSVETVGPRSEKVIVIQQKNPHAAIRAILEIGKLSSEEEIKFEVNIMEDIPETD